MKTPMTLRMPNSVELLLKLPTDVAHSRLLARLIAETARFREELKGLVSRASAKRAHQLLSLREAARRLGVDRGTTLAELIEQRRLRVVHVNGRPRIPAAEVERLAQEGFDTSTSPPKLPTPPKREEPKKPVGLGAAIRALKLSR